MTIKKIDIKIKILKNILSPVKTFLQLLCCDYIPIIGICQQENYDKNRQITTLVSIPTTSAINDAISTNLVFFIPTALV